MLMITAKENEYQHVESKDWKWSGILAIVDEPASRVGGYCHVCNATWMVTSGRADSGCRHIEFNMDMLCRWQVACPSAFAPDVLAVRALGVKVW